MKGPEPQPRRQRAKFFLQTFGLKSQWPLKPSHLRPSSFQGVQPSLDSMQRPRLVQEAPQPSVGDSAPSNQTPPPRGWGTPPPDDRRSTVHPAPKGGSAQTTHSHRPSQGPGTRAAFLFDIFFLKEDPPAAKLHVLQTPQDAPPAPRSVRPQELGTLPRIPLLAWPPAHRRHTRCVDMTPSTSPGSHGP